MHSSYNLPLNQHLFWYFTMKLNQLNLVTIEIHILSRYEIHKHLRMDFNCLEKIQMQIPGPKETRIGSGESLTIGASLFVLFTEFVGY
jgi:hypothetical protein